MRQDGSGHRGEIVVQKEFRKTCAFLVQGLEIGRFQPERERQDPGDAGKLSGICCRKSACIQFGHIQKP